LLGDLYRSMLENMGSDNNDPAAAWASTGNVTDWRQACYRFHEAL
jgi:hypothetical protein